MRDKLASRLGFILLSAGCAIGIGNVWRFPYVTGQSGGALFVLVYFFFLAVLGLPVLVMEFATGRAAQRSIVALHARLDPDHRAWRAHGVLGFVGNVVLMMFYTTVAGWMVLYFLKYLAAAPTDFGGMVSSPGEQIHAMVGVSVVSAAVCAFGVAKGLERVTKWMMLALLALILVLAVNSCLLPGAGAGIRFYLVPDAAAFARLREIGLGTTVVNAMNQAFFTLSLGIGAMSIFGSYIGKDRTLLGEAVNVVCLDTFVAIAAGFITIPACFAYNVEPGQGPGLIFVTLPKVFSSMPGGRWWGCLFFLFMSFAALSTVFAVFETIIACLIDFTGWSRRRASIAVGAGLPLLSLPCVLGFNAWSAFQPFGKGSCVLDLEDFVVSDLLLPLGALAFAIFCSHHYGWGWKGFVDEANTGRGPKISAGLRGYCAWVLPVIILTVFVIGLVRRFG